MRRGSARCQTPKSLIKAKPLGKTENTGLTHETPTHGNEIPSRCHFTNLTKAHNSDCVIMIPIQIDLVKFFYVFPVFLSVFFISLRCRLAISTLPISVPLKTLPQKSLFSKAFSSYEPPPQVFLFISLTPLRNIPRLGTNSHL